MTYTTYGYMWDSNTGVHPADSDLNGYYYNGIYAHQPYVVQRGQFWIDVLGNAPGQCCCLQVDGFTPAGVEAMIIRVPSWLDQRNPIGRGLIYSDRANLHNVVAAADGRPFDLWLSTLDGTLPVVSLPASVRLVAIQAWGVEATGIHADKSAVVNGAWWNARAAA